MAVYKHGKRADTLWSRAEAYAAGAISALRLCPGGAPGAAWWYNRIRGSWPALMRGLFVIGVLPALMLASCDPVISIAGANFPDWLICVSVGAVLAAIARPVLIWIGAERYLRPLVIFYSSVIVLGGLVTWMLFFNRT
jgi:YtcA family